MLIPKNGQYLIVDYNVYVIYPALSLINDVMVKRHKAFTYAKELLKTVCLALRKANVNTAVPWTVFI